MLFLSLNYFKFLLRIFSLIFFGSITIFCSPRILRKIHSAACGLKKYYLRQNFIKKISPFFKGRCQFIDRRVLKDKGFIL